MNTVKTVNLKLNLKNEADQRILSYLKSLPNYSAHIRFLVLEDLIKKEAAKSGAALSENLKVESKVPSVTFNPSSFV